MKRTKIIMDADPPRAWVETVERGVDNYNVAVTGLPDYYPVGFLIKDAGAVLGGVFGSIWGGWLHVRSLWVDSAWRGRGYATRLMAAAEAYALEKKCTNSFLETGSFEARPLYEKLGYRVYAELKDHPVQGHSRYFMTRSFAARAPGRARLGRVKVVMDPYALPEVQNLVRRGVRLHGVTAIGLPEQTWASANFFLTDDDDEIRGGALGNLWGLWLYVAFLWVDRPLRRRGYATKLMAAVEQHAMRRGCTGGFLRTFSFQACPLYDKIGYRVFGELEDYPKGHNLYFLSSRFRCDKQEFFTPELVPKREDVLARLSLAPP
jgi:GNAT superfamily N-acetyltransferase